MLEQPRIVGKNSQMKYLGKARRHVAYRGKQYYDYYFSEYCQLVNFDHRTTRFGVAKGNFEAGYKGFMKYDRREPVYDDEAFGLATHMITASYAQLPKARVTLDFEKFFDKSTSPGYPWNLKHQKKRDFLSSHDCVIYMNQFVRDTREKLVFASNIVKEEPKKLIKIETNDLRVICAMAIEHTAMGNFLFGEMNDIMYETAPTMRIASLVGHTKYRLGWEKVYHRLCKHPNAMDFDFSAFDASVDKRSFQMVINVRLGLFRELTKELIDLVMLYYSYVVYTTVILENGDIYMKDTGNNSGQTNTITDNNIVNEFRWMYAFCKLAPSKDKCTYSYFKKHVELIVQGDDSALTVSDEVKSWYNPKSISEIFTPMNWIGKLEQFSFKTVDDLEFCSLKFGRYGKHIVPVPSHPDKIVTSMLMNGKYKEARFSVLRAMGIRMDVYFDRKLYALFDGYVQYMFKNYQKELHGYEDCTFENLLCNYKTDIQILTLFLTPSR